MVSIALAMPMPHQPLSQEVPIAVESLCFLSVSLAKETPYTPLYLEISCSRSAQSGSKAAALDDCHLYVVIQEVIDITTLSVYVCIVR